MTFPDMSGVAPMYIPKPPGVREMKLGDEWRARWYEEELPPGAPVAYLYASVYMADKGYLTRPGGETAWGVIEGPIGDQDVEGFLHAAARERMGATLSGIHLIGFLECRATSHNPEYKAGEVTVRPVYLTVASDIEDLPAESTYERRRLPQNEYIALLRQRYPEIIGYMEMAANKYGVMRAKGEA